MSGHEYTPENTYTAPNGQIRCRTCSRISEQKRRQPRLAKEIDPEEIRRLYEQGLGATAIRARLGVGLPRLYRAMEDLNLPRRNVGRVPRKDVPSNG